MRAILLAAGRGERLRPLTDEIPKCLVPVNGRPLIDYWLHNLAAIGVDRFLVNLHYRADMVRAYLESGPFARQIEFAHERALLGTGGTLLANRNFLEFGTTIVAHVDNLCQCDFGAFARAHRTRPRGVDVTLMTFRASEPSACGVVELDEIGIVRAFHEKVPAPPGDIASAAVLIVEPNLVRDLASLGRTMIDLSRDVLPRMLGRMLAWYNAKYHRDIGNPDSWLEAQLDFPGDGRQLAASSYWASCCGEADGPLAARIVRALERMWGAEEVLQDVQRKPKRTAQVLLVAERFTKSDISRLGDRFDIGRTLVLFWHVPPSFSAARLYRETGIRSIGFCSP